MAFWNPRSIEMDEAGVRCRRGKKIVEQVTWAALVSVDVITTSNGPLADDMFFLLGGTDGSGVAVASNLAPDGFVERLQQLPGFDSDQLILASGSVENARFHCWPSES
jgi:hypothetical protein